MNKQIINRVEQSAVVIGIVLAAAGISFGWQQPSPSPQAAMQAKKFAKATSKSKKATAAKAAAPVYECPDCHDKFTEAEAKKDGMKCTCCKATLVKIKAVSAKSPATKTS